MSNLLIKGVPPETMEFILREQFSQKVKQKKNKVSIGATVIQLLDELAEIRKQQNQTPSL